MKIFFKCITYTVLLTLLLVPIRLADIGPGIIWSSLVGFITFFYLTLFLLVKFKNKTQFWKIILALIIGECILFPNVIYDLFFELPWFLPQLVIQTIGIICGYLYLRLSKPLNVFSVLIGCLIAVFMFFQGFDYWLHYLNYETFTGKVNAYSLSQKLEGINQHNNKVTNQTLENKIVLLDFWHTRCGVCFQKFPQLQAFYDKYKNDDSIAVFAVDKPLEEDIQKGAFKVIEEEGYNFPVLLPTDEELPEKFGVKVYPTTFVINRQGNIVYKGGIEGAILMAEDLKRSSQ
jgi:thiol-disulfide isomerase/thioredoxin